MIQGIVVFNHILVDMNSHELPYSDGGNVHICPVGCSHAYNHFCCNALLTCRTGAVSIITLLFAGQHISHISGRTAYLNCYTFMFVRGHMGFCT